MSWAGDYLWIRGWSFGHNHIAGRYFISGGVGKDTLFVGDGIMHQSVVAMRPP